MSKRKKYILITLCAMAGLVVVALVGARVYLSTSHAQRTIQAKIDTAIPGAITWDDLSLSLFGGRVELTHFLLSGPEGEKLAGFDRLYLDLAVTDLFKKTVTVADFVLASPWADLKRDQNGDLNLLKAFPKPGPAPEQPKEETGESPVDIVVASARITDGRFSYEDLAKDVAASVSGVGLTADFRLKAMSGGLRFEIRKGEIESPDLSTRLDAFLAEATLKDGRIDPLTLHIKTPPAELDLSGAVASVFDKPDMDLTLTADMALADIRDLLALEPPLSGDLSLELAASGPVDNPNANLSLTHDGGDLLEYKVTSIALDAALADRVLDLKTLRIAAAAGKATLSGRVDAQKAFPDGFLAKTIDLDALAYDLHLTGNEVLLAKVVPESAGVRGTAGTDLKVKGTGVLYPAIDADVKLDLTGKEIRAPGIEDAMDVAASLDASLSDAAATIRSLSVKAGDADLSASGTFDIRNLTTSAEIDLKAPNLGRTLASVGVGGISGGANLQAKVDGPVTAPVFDVKLDGNGLAYDDITVGDIRLDAASNNQGVVTIATLSINNSGSEITANGTVSLFGKASLQIDPDLPMDVSLTLKTVEAGDFLREPPVAGRLSGTLKADGALKNLKAAVDLAARDLAAADAAIGDVDLLADFSDGRVRIEKLTIQNKNSAVRASGTAGVLKPGTFEPLDDPTFDIALSSDRIAPGDFLPDAAGALSLDATVGGSAARPTADVDISGKALQFADIRIGDAAADVRLAPSGLLTINRLAVSNQGSSITGKGTLRLYRDAPGFDPTLPLDLSLALKDVEAGDFIQDEPAKGTISGSASVTGSIKAPKADLDLQARNLAVADNTIGDVDVNLAFADGRARIDEIRVQNRDSNLRISGTAQVLSPGDMAPLDDPAFDLKVASDGVFLQDFLPDMKGRVALNADLTGSVKQPRGTVDLSASDLDLGAQKIKAVQLTARMTGDRIRIDPLKATVRKDETLTVAGTYTLPDAYDLTVRSSGISLSSIDAIRKAGVAQGAATLDLSGRGTLADPSLSGDIAVTNLRVRGKPLDDVRLNVNLADGVGRITGDAGFDLSATYRLEEKTFSATADFQGTDLGPYFSLADQPRLGGVLSGRIQAEGDADAPQGVTATVDLSNLLLTYNGAETIAADRLEAAFRDGTVSIPGFSLDLLQKGRLTISGTAAVGGALSIDVDGDIPLDVVRAFTDALPDIDGKVALSADIGGQMAQPRIRADAILQNVAMSVPGIAQRLHDLNGTIRMTPESLTLKDVKGRLDDGRFFLKGKAGLRRFQPTDIDLGLRAENLPVSVPDMMELALNADLGMSGNPRGAAVGGEVTILEGSYYKDINLSLITPLKGLATKKRETAPARPPRRTQPGEPAEPTLLDNVALDIFVKNRAPFLVDNNLAYLEIDPDLHVEGTLDNPVVAGRAEIRNGTVTYQGRTFEVTKGVIDFLNPYEIEPTLDISAKADIRKWQVTLAISGTPDALDVDLSSTPTLDDNDILSLILFGRTGGELISGEGGTTQAPGQMVADIVSKTVGEDLRKATGLDTLEVEMGDSGAEGGADVKVTMGKDLSRRMSVKYSVESRDGEMVGRTSAEYKILENLLMSGFQDNTGAFGGELKFRMEFR